MNELSHYSLRGFRTQVEGEKITWKGTLYLHSEVVASIKSSQSRIGDSPTEIEIEFVNSEEQAILLGCFSKTDSEPEMQTQALADYLSNQADIVYHRRRLETLSAANLAFILDNDPPGQFHYVLRQQPNSASIGQLRLTFGGRLKAVRQGVKTLFTKAPYLSTNFEAG